MRQRLTDLGCRAAKPRPTLYRLTDGAGLTLEVTPSGSKLWRLRFVRNGKASMMSLGRFPDVPLVEARKRATEARQDVERGVNPAVERKIRRERVVAASADTFAAIACDWIDNETNWTKTHRTTVERRFARYVFPKIGDWPITKISALDVLKVLQNVAKQTPRTAHKLRGQIGAVFRYGIIKEAVKDDPTVALYGAIKAPDPKHKEPLDMPAYLRLARSHPSLDLLLLLACRPGELRRMQWAQIDKKAKTWTLPAALMKSRREHMWPLSEPAVEVLDRIPKVDGNPYVFAGERRGKPIGNDAMRRAMRGAKMRGTPHSCRTMFSTWAHEQGIATHIIEFALSHVDRDTTRASYNKALYLPQRREMAEQWGAYVRSLALKKK